MKPNTVNVLFREGRTNETKVEASVTLGDGAMLYVRPMLDPATLAALRGAVLDAAKWALEQERKEAADEGDAS